MADLKVYPKDPDKKVYSGGFADKRKADAFHHHINSTGGKVINRSVSKIYGTDNHTHDVHYHHPDGPSGPHMIVRK